MANKNYPQGYWSAVFEQAVSLLNIGIADSAESAYWLARKDMDRALGAPASQSLARGARRSQEQLALV
jgi:hypothetical protein